MKMGDVNISDVSLRIHARTIIRECEKFYADPENMKRFEAWKAERDKKKEEAS